MPNKLQAILLFESTISVPGFCDVLLCLCFVIFESRLSSKLLLLLFETPSSAFDAEQKGFETLFIPKLVPTQVIPFAAELEVNGTVLLLIVLVEEILF